MIGTAAEPSGVRQPHWAARQQQLRERDAGDGASARGSDAAAAAHGGVVLRAAVTGESPTRGVRLPRSMPRSATCPLADCLPSEGLSSPCHRGLEPGREMDDRMAMAQVAMARATTTCSRTRENVSAASETARRPWDCAPLEAYALGSCGTDRRFFFWAAEHLVAGIDFHG